MLGNGTGVTQTGSVTDRNLDLERWKHATWWIAVDPHFLPARSIHSEVKRGWMMKTLRLSCILPLCLLAVLSAPQEGDFNYDESKVVPYTLPDPLLNADGTRVTSARDWKNKRREEILRLFETDVYGRSPARPRSVQFHLNEVDTGALQGLATRKQVTIALSNTLHGLSMELLLYIPNSAKTPAPAFLGLNFNGNQSIHSDPRIAVSQTWMRDNKEFGIVNHRATEASRGVESSRWAVETI